MGRLKKGKIPRGVAPLHRPVLRRPPVEGIHPEYLAAGAEAVGLFSGPQGEPFDTTLLAAVTRANAVSFQLEATEGEREKLATFAVMQTQLDEESGLIGMQVLNGATKEVEVFEMPYDVPLHIVNGVAEIKKEGIAGSMTWFFFVTEHGFPRPMRKEDL